MIAVDAPVLVELLTDGPRADAAEASLRQALGSGRVVVCDAALAVLCASLRNGAEALGALEEMGVHYNAIESKSALRAGASPCRFALVDTSALPNARQSAANSSRSSVTLSATKCIDASW